MRNILMWFAFCLAALPVVMASDRAQEETECLSETALYDLLVGELKEVLFCGRQFAPVPNNITRVFVSPGHLPCFTMGTEDLRAEKDIVRAANSFQKDHGTFHLLTGGNVAGWGLNGEAVLTGPDGSGGIIAGPQGTRTTGVPRGLPIRRAVLAGGQWIYQTPSGLFRENGALWEDAGERLDTCEILSARDQPVIVRPNQAEAGRGREKLPLVVAVSTTGGLEKHVYSNMPVDGIRSVVKCRDGRFLGIGSRLVFLRDDYPLDPSESEFDAALKSARDGDVDGFRSRIENLTVYSREQLRGLAGRLSSMGRDQDQWGRFERILGSTLTALNAGGIAGAGAPTIPDPTNRLVRLIATYETQTRQTLKELTQTMAADPRSVARLAGTRISEGYQYFGGLWIQNPEIIFQDAAENALVALRYIDPETGVLQYGVFSILPQGRLSLLMQLDEARNYGKPFVFKDHEGNTLIFLRGKGLARLGPGKITWLNQDDQMKLMVGVLGCDQFGRIYFSGTSDSRSGFNQTWVYQLNGTSSHPRAVANLFMQRSPAVDTLGRLWFIGFPREDGRGGIRGMEKSSSTVSLITATPRKFTRAPEDEESGKIPVQENIFGAPTLYCYDDTGLHKYFSHAQLANATLLAGEAGSMVVVTPGPQGLAHLIEDDVVYSSRDLFEMAATHFDRLLRLAPTRILPPTSSAEFSSRESVPVLLRIKDLLWVCDGKTVEVYRQGRSLSMGKRLTLSGARLARPALIGPVSANGAQRVLIAATPSRLDSYVWATPGPEGIALAMAQPPEAAQGSSHLTDPAGVIGEPVVDGSTGRIFYHQGYDRVWAIAGPDQYKMFFNAGRPVLFTKDGKLLLRREARVYSGYRLLTDDAISDIPITFVKSIHPVFEEQDGTLLCTGPEGLVWLKRETGTKFAIARSLSLAIPGTPAGYLGRSAKSLYFLTRGEYGISVMIVPIGQ